MCRVEIELTSTLLQKYGINTHFFNFCAICIIINIHENILIYFGTGTVILSSISHTKITLNRSYVMSLREWSILDD